MVDVNTPVLTFEEGWSTMRGLRVGQFVYGSDGTRTKITNKSQIETPTKCYRVVLSTGEEFATASQQCWLTLTDKERVENLRRDPVWREARRLRRPSRAVEISKKPGVSKTVTKLNMERVHNYLEPTLPQPRTTEEIFKTLAVRNGQRANHSLEVVKPLKTPGLNFIIDPYLFGLWLGDGYRSSGMIGMLRDDWRRIDPFLSWPISWSKVEVSGRKQPFEMRRFDGLWQLLRNALHAERAVTPKGRKYWKIDKRIPDDCLLLSYNDRVALLRGIMDTDGTCMTSGQCEILLSDRELVEDIQCLLSTLGSKAVVREKPIRGYRSGWRIKFSATFRVFNLSRKAERQNLDTNAAYTGRRYIKSINRCSSRPVQFIEVDNQDGSFLVGRTLIVAHGSLYQ